MLGDIIEDSRATSPGIRSQSRQGLVLLAGLWWPMPGGAGDAFTLLME
jgi:hypothetical protein